MWHKLLTFGKWLLSGVAVASIVLAILLGWAGFVAEGAGQMDSALAFVLMAGALAYSSGGLLAVLWVRNF